MREYDLTVTVVIPAFNAADFLERAVASALAQSPAVLEVIVVDDASTDTTRAVAQALAKNDSRLRVLALDLNGGPAKARNVGFSAAKGDWIAILDADDAFVDGRLAALLDAAALSSADIVADNIASYDYVAGKVVGIGVRSIEEPRTIDVYDFVGAARGSGKDIDWGLLKPMFNRTFLARAAVTYPENLRHGEDFIFVFRALLAGARFVFTPQPGYLYTQRWGELSKTASGLSRTRIDYDAMAADTLQLLDDPHVKADARLCDLLRNRYQGMRRLEIHQLTARYLGERRWRSLIGLLAREPSASRSLTRMVARKLRSLARS